MMQFYIVYIFVFCCLWVYFNSFFVLYIVWVRPKPGQRPGGGAKKARPTCLTAGREKAPQNLPAHNTQAKQTATPPQHVPYYYQGGT